jgi:tRNA dimethylallyltransferase
MNQQKKFVIIIAGPTAVGKTSVAISLARYFNTEIISADSRQCYKELNIGVARPSEEELKTVPHHFIASHSIQEEVTAISFEQYALEKTRQLFEKNNFVILAGGTGLYIRAFCKGLDNIPSINPEIRQRIVAAYEEKGIGWLQQLIKEKDPDFYTTGEIQNPQRMMRALEVLEATGRSIRSFQKGDKAERQFNIIKVALELPKEELRRNINQRVEAMMQAGLLKEVKGLLELKHLNALQTVGYAELFDYLAGKTSLDEATELIKVHTRQYAKRQMTWFKKDKAFNWFSPADSKGMQEFIKTNLC